MICTIRLIGICINLIKLHVGFWIEMSKSGSFLKRFHGRILDLCLMKIKMVPNWQYLTVKNTF